MSFLGALGKLLGHLPQESATPDITYNPNPNKNIPYSAHSMELARLGNEYTKNPQDPKFLGVDPALFGYPEDRAPALRVTQGRGFQQFNSDMPATSLPQGSVQIRGPQQFNSVSPLTSLPQGGLYNPGYVQQPGSYTRNVQRGGWR